MALMHLLHVVGLIGFRETEAHGYLATPPSKTAADIRSFALPFDEYWLRATWFLDKASLNGDARQKPWSAPGYFNYKDAYEIAQQAFHPCGCYDPGSPEFCAGVKLASGFGETTPGHAAEGPFPQIAPPKWSRGSAQETAFNLYANHAGGYVYMLCLKSTFDKCKSDHLPESMSTTTKEQLLAYEKCVWECFENNVLDFVNGSQTIQYGNRVDLTVNAKTVTKGPDGTLPKGSVWREVPIPDSAQISSGQNDHGRCTWDAIDESTFSSDEAKDHFIASFGNRDNCDSGPEQHHPRKWHIKDKVKIPDSLPAGKYLLMWRWECGLADQLWSNCADVEVLDESFPTSTSSESSTSTQTLTTLLPESTTSTNTGARCSDAPLPTPWSAGGAHTCLTYQEQSLAHCDHVELRRSCCFCGGGLPEPLLPTTTPPSCTDAQLPIAWSGGGVHSCSTYEQHGGLAYCAQEELAEACCFCNGGIRYSALSLQAEVQQPSGELSRAGVFTPKLVAIVSLFVGVITHL